jgi:hypothetical protein
VIPSWKKARSGTARAERSLRLKPRWRASSRDKKSPEASCVAIGEGPEDFSEDFFEDFFENFME